MFDYLLVDYFVSVLSVHLKVLRKELSGSNLERMVLTGRLCQALRKAVTVWQDKRAVRGSQ